MLNTIRGARIAAVQLQQIRLGHRVRGNPPIYARSLKQRIQELNYKDELYTSRIDIGFPPIKQSKEVRDHRLQHLRKIKSDKNLEKSSRNLKLEINLEDVRKEWLKTTGPFHKKQIADHYGVFEHLYGEGYFLPHLNIDVLYNLKDGTFLPVCAGNVIKPTEALEAPIITYDSDDSALWTLAFTSLDGHLYENEKEYVHWLVANIPGNAIEKGETLVEYLQPFPLKGTGYHRYVFVLYKQDKTIDYALPKVTSSSALQDRTFVTREWYKKHQDNITPIGLAFYQSDWDYSVRSFFHNVLNAKEPEYEYDFPAPYIRPQEWFPRRKPFNLYMDKYRDPKKINEEYLLRKLKNEDPFKRPPPPLKFPNAQQLPKSMPSWLKLHEKKIRLGWGRVNDV